MGSQVQGFHLVECQSGQRICWRAADTVVCVFGCFEGGVCRQYASAVNDGDGLRQHLEIVLGNDALCSCLGGFRFVNIQRVGGDRQYLGERCAGSQTPAEHGSRHVRQCHVDEQHIWCRVIFKASGQCFATGCRCPDNAHRWRFLDQCTQCIQCNGIIIDYGD